MSQLTYTGRVLKDGKLCVSPNAKRALSLRPGDELRITLRRKDEEISDEELPLESLDDAALRKVARSRVSANVQQRMETLLIKNQDGTLTPAERREMLKSIKTLCVSALVWHKRGFCWKNARRDVMAGSYVAEGLRRLVNGMLSTAVVTV